MKQLLTWEGCREAEGVWFPATVPGAIQLDYAKYKNFPQDLHYGENVERFRELEEDTWLYRADFQLAPGPGQKLFFVTDGIEYQYEIRCNGVLLAQHEGMFTRLELDLTPCLKPEGNRLEIRILPHPTSGHPRGVGRDEACRTCKPAVQYGWDWHPRLLSSGLWEEAYLELRDAGYIRRCEYTYTLNDQRTQAEVAFAVDCDQPVQITLWDPDGKQVYQGDAPSFTVQDVQLWWCSGQGEPCLYRYTVSSQSHTREGWIGFRTVELVMNQGAWEHPSQFPMTRSTPPITLCLNGRRIFAKGSNWVRPELFPGVTGRETYLPLLQLAKDAHMNILRCWGGSEIFKESFYQLCDQLGLMVWQEFPLSCNCYPDEPHYLEVLEQESRAIVSRLRQHPCLVLWCGGNELFNNWSRMTDQALPLRLLNRVCYELDPKTPFLMTSPLMGMGHGSYTFYEANQDRDVFQIFQRAGMNAYTEFGISSLADPALLRKIIPEAEWFPIETGGAWELHHGLRAWREKSWVQADVLEQYWDKADSVEELCRESQWLQKEGLKAIFEEARRQWPVCSFSTSWCFNEPWLTAANTAMLSYPHQPKPAYEAVKEALRPVMPSARIPKFAWLEGERFTAELWLLNDSPEQVEDTIVAYLELDGETQEIMRWHTGPCGPNSHLQGHQLQVQLPKLTHEAFTLRLEAACGSSVYQLLNKSKPEAGWKAAMNEA